MKYIYSGKRYIPGNTFSYNFAGGDLYIKKKIHLMKKQPNIEK